MNPQLDSLPLSGIFTGFSIIILLLTCIIGLGATIGFLTRSKKLQMMGYAGLVGVLMGATVLYGPPPPFTLNSAHNTMAWAMLIIGSYALLIAVTQPISLWLFQRSMKKLSDDIHKDPSVDPKTAANVSEIIEDLAKQTKNRG